MNIYYIFIYARSSKEIVFFFIHIIFINVGHAFCNYLNEVIIGLDGGDNLFGMLCKKINSRDNWCKKKEAGRWERRTKLNKLF